MQSLCIVTSDLYEKAGQYKVGIHTGEMGTLSRCRDTPIIRLFITMAEGKAKELDDKIKSEFSSHRINGPGGNDSEFYQTPLNDLYGFIFSNSTNVAPQSLSDEKLQEQNTRFNTTMSLINDGLIQMERSVPINICNPCYQDIAKCIKNEREAFAAGKFKGEQLSGIRKLIMESYKRCPSYWIQNARFGEEIIQQMCNITAAMDNANQIRPDTFKKIPKIVILNFLGTAKDDLLLRKFVFFCGGCNPYIEKYWDELAKVKPDEWSQFKTVGLDMTCPPKDHIKKLKPKAKSKAKPKSKAKAKSKTANTIDQQQFEEMFQMAVLKMQMQSEGRTQDDIKSYSAEP